MKQLDRYLARTVLGSIGLVMAVLTVLGALFLFIDEQSDIGVGRYGVIDALMFTALNVPRFVLQALPAGALIGAMLGIGQLARSNEITVMRAAGVSRLRLVLAVLSGGAVIVALALLVGEYVAPRLEQMADERKAFARYENVSFAGRGGAWIRDGNTVINVEQRSSTEQYGGMLVFELSSDNRLQAIGRAERAVAGDNDSWQLFDYAESRFAGDRVSAQRQRTRELQSGASAGFLQLAVAAPEKLALQTLYRAVEYRRANDLGVATYELAFWSRIARIVALMVAVAFAVPFGFGSLRSTGAGARMTLGLAVGIVYFFLQRAVESGALVFDLSPWMVAWLPTALLLLASVVMLARAR